MSKENRSVLEEYFETGDRPTQKQFEDLIESVIVQRDDEVWVSGPDKRVGIGEETPEGKLHVSGNAVLEGSLMSKKADDQFWIGNQDGAVLELHGNNKNDGREGEMALIAGSGAKGGFRFIQNHGAGINPQWVTYVAITKDGNMGIGTKVPGEKLHVVGNILVEENVLANQGNSHFLLANQGGAFVELHGNNKNDGRAGQISFVASHGAAGGFKFVQDAGPGANPRWVHQMKIEKDGRVQIGTELPVPGSRLQLDNLSGSDTGLCLPQGAGPDYVMLSNSAGNARWAPKTDLDDGDWVVNNGDLIAGPGGNVGIGVPVPTQKLDIQGNLVVRGNRIFGDADANYMGLYSDPNGGSYITLAGDNLALRGGGYVTLVAGQGTAPNEGGGFNFYQKRRKSGGGIDWQKNMRITKDGDFHICNDRDIFFRGAGNHDPDSSHDRYHGIGFFGPSKPFAGVAVDGPVTFGTSGGALGSTKTGQKIALQWDDDQAVDFKGAITVNNRVPLLVERYRLSTSSEISYDPQNQHYGYNTGKLVSYFSAAVVVGFSATQAQLRYSNKVKMGISTYIRGGTWWVSADIESDNINESWSFDILFIRTAIGELSGLNWGDPLTYP